MTTAPGLFDPCRTVVLAFEEDPDGYPRPTSRMLEVLQQHVAGAPEEALAAVLRIAPRMPIDQEPLVREGLRWLELISIPTKGPLSDRARHHDKMTAALARFVRAALGEPPKKP